MLRKAKNQYSADILLAYNCPKSLMPTAMIKIMLVGHVKEPNEFCKVKKKAFVYKPVRMLTYMHADS